MKKTVLLFFLCICLITWADIKYRVYTSNGYFEFLDRQMAYDFYNKPSNNAKGLDSIQFTAIIDTVISPFNNDPTLVRIRQTARGQNIVGTRDDSLTNAQLNTIVKLLMWKKEAFDKNGRVKPFRDWLDN